MANPFDQFDVKSKAGNPFDQFDSPKKVIPKRTLGEAFTDVGAGVVKGVGSLVQLPGQLYGLATGDFEKSGALGLGEDISKYGESLKSAGLKAQEAARSEKIEEAAKQGQVSAFSTAFSETVTNPALLLNFIAEQAPNLIPGLTAARVAKGIAGTTSGVTAAVRTGAVQQGADIGAQTYAQVYEKLKDSGMGDEEAAGRALGLARASGASAAIISLLAQRLPGAKSLEETFAGVQGKAGRVIGAGRGALGETIGEVAEETGGKFGQNLAMREVDPSQSLTEGLGETAGMAAVGGVGLGGVSGALQTQRPKATPETTQAKEADIPLMLTGEMPFTPVGLPDGSVAMTREDLANYEQEQFDKKYAAQDIERTDPETLLLEDTGVFRPVGLPDGSVAMTKEDLANYEQEQFDKKYASQAVEDFAPPQAEKAAEVEAPATYATAMKELEFLKRQSRTQENKDRMEQLKTFSDEFIKDRVRASQEPISEESAKIRAWMESGMTEQEAAQEAAKEEFKPIDKLLEKFKTASLQKQKAPETAEDKEILELTSEAKKLAGEYNRFKSGSLKGKSMRPLVANKLTPTDTFDIGGRDKNYSYLSASPSNRPVSLSTLVADGVLDDYLPPDLRVASGLFDEQNAVEFIKEKIRNKEFQPYEISEKLKKLGGTLGEIEARIDELSIPTKISQEVADIPLEERKSDAAYLAEQEINPSDFDAYYQGMEEKSRSNASPDQIKNADSHAKDVGGRVVYQDGDLSLVQGYSVLTGAPVYVPVKGDMRTRVDVDNYTGNLITPEQKSALSKIKQQIESANQETHKTAPFIQFRDGIAFSKGTPKEIQGIAKEWKGILKLNSNLYITTIEDVQADKDKYTGPHQAIGSSNLNANDNGSMRKLPNGDFYIAFTKSTSVTKMLEVLAHEMGHMHQREVFDNVDPTTKKLLEDEHKKWLTNQKGKTARDLVNALRAKTTAKTTTVPSNMTADELTSYWKSFGEWYADQTSRWALTSDKPVSVVEKFFTKLGAALRRFYSQIKNSGYLPSETFKKYMDEVSNSDFKIAEAEVVKSPSGQYEMQFSKNFVESTKEKIQEKLQKRDPINREALEGVNASYVEALGRVFNPQNKTIVDRVDGLRDNFFKKLAQGIADQYRSIKDYSPEAYMLARLSKSVDGGLEGLTFNGEVFLDDGALNIKKDTKGLMQALAPIGKETDRYMMWVALNRDARMPAEKRSISDELIKGRGQLSAGTIDGKSRLDVYKSVQKDMNRLNKSVLDIARKQGLIDEQAYQRFSNDIFYIPFYKAMEDGGDVQSAATAAGLTSQSFSKALKGGERPFGDLMENTLRNWSHILSASMKNQAATSTINAAVEQGAAREAAVGEPKKGMVKIVRDGSPVYFEVMDPMLLEAITAIGYMGPKSKFLDVAKDFKNILQFGVTISPAFKIRNLFRDSVSALAVTDLGRNPFANVIQGWALSEKNNPAYISAMAGGGVFTFGTAYEGDNSKLIKRLLKDGVKGENILDTNEKVKNGLRMAFNKYQEWGNKSESANRLALYQQMKDRGMSHLEASFYARDMLDFSMQGSWPAFRLVAQVVPFLNARVQGLYKLGRDGLIPTSRVLYNTVTGKEIDASDAQKARSFGYTTTAVALASMALYLAFKDDEEFKKREDWDRDNFWWFKLPGMEYAIRIPKPFEIGAFGTIAERTLEQIVDSGAEGKQFQKSISHMLSDTFSLNPTPQMIKPIIDLYANKDSFTGSPIESAGMERLSKQERTTDNTSPLAIALGGVSNVVSNVTGDKTELSPVQIDYAIKAYFGWLGGTAASLSQYAAMPFSKGAYPDTKPVDTLSLGFIKTLPSNQSKYVSAFYESNRDIGQAYADMRHYVEIGDSAKVMELYEKKGDKIALAKFYDKTSKDMAKMRQVISSINRDAEMSGAQKRVEIDRVKELIGMLAEQAEQVRKSMKQ